jgi:hypothetical protein
MATASAPPHPLHRIRSSAGATTIPRRCPRLHTDKQQRHSQTYLKATTGPGSSIFRTSLLRRTRRGSRAKSRSMTT